MNRVLTISDSHNKWWIIQRIMENVEHTSMCFLGDWIDDFNEQLIDVEKSAELMVKLSCSTNNTLIQGNHDNAVMYPSRFTACSGWTMGKQKLVAPILKGHIHKFRTHAFVDGWILSHAGFSPYLVGIGTQSEIMAEIDAQSAQALQCMRSGVFHPFLSVSRYRGGNHLFGGPFWQDWNELKPLRTSNGGYCSQLTGHTPAALPRVIEHSDGSKTVCLDTHMKHFAVIEDGELTIHDTPASWLKRPAAKGPRTRLRLGSKP